MFNHMLAEIHRAKHSNIIRVYYTAGVFFPALFLFLKFTIFENRASSNFIADYLTTTAGFLGFAQIVSVLTITIFTYKKNDVVGIISSFGYSKENFYIYEFFSSIIHFFIFAIFELIYIYTICLICSVFLNLPLPIEEMKVFMSLTFFSVLSCITIYNSAFGLSFLFDSSSLGLFISFVLGTLIISLYDTEATFQIGNDLFKFIIQFFSSHFHLMTSKTFNIFIVVNFIFYFALGLLSFRRREL